MSSEPRGFVDRLVDLAWKLFGVALLIWLAIELIGQVWQWLVGGAVVVGLIWLLWRLYRARRDLW